MSTRILIVDDDDALRDSLQLVLSSEGFEVVSARDGQEALGLLASSAPEIVLCDLRMPGMDGMELIPLLVRRLPDSTLIMMSAYGTEELAIEAMQRGAYDYLAKPFVEARRRLGHRLDTVRRTHRRRLTEHPA